MEYYVYVLIFAVTIISIATLIAIGLVLWWLYDNFPFKYIKLDNSFVDTPHELHPDIYQYSDAEVERE